MTDKNLVPVEDRRQAQAARRRQQREAALAETDRARAAVPKNEPAGVPDVVRPVAFVLPPRAELQQKRTR